MSNPTIPSNTNNNSSTDIQLSEFIAMLAKVNHNISSYNIKFKPIGHFTGGIGSRDDRLNNPRNNPRLTLPEIENLLSKGTQAYHNEIIALQDGESFQFSGNTSHINMVCRMSTERSKRKVFLITVMRKVDWTSRPSDSVFVVSE